MEGLFTVEETNVKGNNFPLYNLYTIVSDMGRHASFSVFDCKMCWFTIHQHIDGNETKNQKHETAASEFNGEASDVSKTAL